MDAVRADYALIGRQMTSYYAVTRRTPGSPPTAERSVATARGRELTDLNTSSSRSRHAGRRINTRCSSDLGILSVG